MIRDLNDIPSFKWATVRGTNPLSIQLDGDSSPLALIPDSLVDPNRLSVGDRVRVELSLRKCVIHGASNGIPSLIVPWTTPTIAPGSGFTIPGYGMQYCVTPYRVEFKGALYRASAPTGFTLAFKLPPEVPFPVSQMRHNGRLDHTLEIAVTNNGEVQVKAQSAVTSGIGYMFDGLGYAY